MVAALGSPLASEPNVTDASFDLVVDVETSILQATRSDASQSFSALSPDERHHLREWQSAARAIGIDAVEDMASRPWPCPIADTVIGVFQAGTEAAPWLVIGHDGAWAVACCAEGMVSRTLHSLAEALGVIYPGLAASGAPGLPG
jgi:hypothetical protein